MAEAHRRVARSNLPAELTCFVGRRQELAEAKRLLEEHRLLTLTGPGGVGKTRLGVRLAEQLRRAFPDGVYLVDLALLENELLLGDTVLDALGVVDQSARPAVEVLTEYLSGLRLLLLVDNCEHLVDACGWLVDALLRAAPELCVLTTSREPLRVEGESVLEVAPVPDADAVELFAQRARVVRPGFRVTAENRAAVAWLCARLDRIPLAIELAAARLRDLTVDEVRDRLDDRFRLLAMPAGTAGRHASMQATLDWSVQSCSKPERLLWARLSVFAGDFDLDAAEEIGSGSKVPRGDVLDLVSSLVDKSIIVARRDGPVVRYGWLETLREYGRGLLAADGEEPALRRRHRDWYLSLTRPLWAQDGDPCGYRVTFGRLLAQRANLRAALEYCLTEPGEQRAALDLASALLYVWLGSVSLGEGRHWLARALDRDREPSAERARALWVASWLATEQGDLVSAEQLLAEARGLAVRLGDRPALAWATALAGYGALHTGELSRARSLLEEGLSQLRALRYPLGLFATMSGLAQTTSYLGDPVSATISEELLAAGDRYDFDPARSTALRTLGLEMVRQERLVRATDLLREGLRAGRRADHRYGVATCLDLLAWAAAASGEHERSARLRGASRGAYQRIGATMPRPQRERGDS
ncbi:MAG TPA: AAA family ATPase, partial [Rugosimonospora sp.]|nr:AAA family ATPase [Rugosimonospora sp.]